MFRLGFALRRLRGPHTPYASYATAATESPSLRRTVRVENLPEGYNVSNIVDTVKANPAETIIPAKDHLLVRFFDEGAARRCVEANKELSLKIDESTSPALNTMTVAMLAKYNATRTMRLRKVPESFTESQFNEILSAHGGVVSSRFDKSRGGIIEAQFLDMPQAIKARIDFSKTGAVPRFMDSDHFTYPEWYSKEDEQPNQARLVKISGLKDYETREMCARWTGNYDNIPPASFITARYSSPTEISIYFPTSALARQFMSICEPLAAGKCTLSLHISEHVVSRGVITAIDQGARPLISLPFKGILSAEMQKQLRRFFHRFGRVDSGRIHHTGDQLIVPFASVIGASTFVFHSHLPGLRTKPPPEFVNVLPTFVRAYHWQ